MKKVSKVIALACCIAVPAASLSSCSLFGSRHHSSFNSNNYSADDSSSVSENTAQEDVTQNAGKQIEVIASQQDWEKWGFYFNDGADGEGYVADNDDDEVYLQIKDSGENPWSVQARFPDPQYGHLTLEKGAKYHIHFEYRIWVYTNNYMTGQVERWNDAANYGYNKLDAQPYFSLEQDAEGYHRYFEMPLKVNEHIEDLDGKGGNLYEGFTYVDTSFTMHDETDNNVFFGFNSGNLHEWEEYDMHAEVRIKNFRIEKVS